jgi:type I restriction enzyme S subunit
MIFGEVCIDKALGKIQELTDRMKADKVLPKSFLIQQLELELFSTLTCLSLGSVAFVEKGKTGIKSAEPGEYPLVVTAAERQTCKSYDFETEAAIDRLLGMAMLL